MQTLSEENYLKTIFILAQHKGEKITPTAIAEALGNNPASVVDMLRKLSDKKLIEYDKSKGARMTDKGGNTALQVVRRHRLWEVFLKEKLGYTWDVVHDIAEQLEHVQQEELADRLDKYLDYPSYDPHGDPIPQANGKMAKLYKTTLAEIPVAKVCKVVAVKDTTNDFLKYLQKLSIGIGTKVKIMEKISFDDSIILLINNKDNATVSKKFAESLLVE